MIQKTTLSKHFPYSVQYLEDGEISTIFSLHFPDTDIPYVSINGIAKYKESKIKLLLHPLSDLIKEIQIKGKRFIPIIELAKEFHKSDYKVTSYVIVNNYGVQCFVDNSRSRYMYFDINPDILENKYKIVKKLHEWGFDTDNLISSGDAVPV